MLAGKRIIDPNYSLVHIIQGVLIFLPYDFTQSVLSLFILTVFPRTVFSCSSSENRSILVTIGATFWKRDGENGNDGR